MISKIFLFTMAIIVGVCFRLFPHTGNLTPLYSMALFSGLLIKKPLEKLIIPLMTLFISDCFLGFYSSMGFTYFGLMTMVLLGHNQSKRIRLLSVMAASSIGALVFFFVSNLGVFLSHQLYPFSFNGLIRCYINALPFLKNTLTSTLLFSLAFYLVYFIFVSCCRLSDNKDALEHIRP